MNRHGHGEHTVIAPPSLSVLLVMKGRVAGATGFRDPPRGLSTLQAFRRPQTTVDRKRVAACVTAA